jgi:hypothetical protein
MLPAEARTMALQPQRAIHHVIAPEMRPFQAVFVELSLSMAHLN